MCGGAGVVGSRQVWPGLTWTSVTLKGSNTINKTTVAPSLKLTGSSSPAATGVFCRQAAAETSLERSYLSSAFSVYEQIVSIFLSRSQSVSQIHVYGHLSGPWLWSLPTLELLTALLRSPAAF